MIFFSDRRMLSNTGHTWGWLLLLMCLLHPGSELAAHADIDLQIHRLNRQIACQPDRAELYHQRAELHRAHHDWSAAGVDFARLRELQPDYPELDFLEARYFLDASQPEKALQRVNRFMDTNPQHVTAMVTRAGVHQALGQCRAAALDIGRAIHGSKVRGPELYLLQARLLLQPGCKDPAGSELVMDKALDDVGPVVALVQLASSLKLFNSKPAAALGLLEQLPASVKDLPDWRYRQALGNCLASQPGRARNLLEHVQMAINSAPKSRQANWRLVAEAAADLLAKPLNQTSCQAAVAKQLDHDSRLSGK